MGEVFAGRYELIDQIGEGGMGGVWRAHDRRNDRVVAAKVLRQSDAGSLLRFMREQGMRIHHPHVVTPLGWAGEDNRVLLTMDLVDGGSVASLSDRGPLPPLYVAELLRQLLEGLGAVHEQRVVHRDIKPGNLLLSATGTGRPYLWLTDFGIAVSMDAPRLTSTTIVMGTPGYIAPEQMRGADPEPRHDLYAVGMVGLQLLTGHRPRAGVRSDRRDLPPRPANVPDPLWDGLVALADPDPAGRPATALAAVDLLNHPKLVWRDQDEVRVDSALPPIGEAQGDFRASTGADGHTRGHREGGTRALSGGAGTRMLLVVERSRRKWKRPALLILTPLLAAAAITGIWTVNNRTPQPGPPGLARLGATCAFYDVGTHERDQHGVLRVCALDGSSYVWSTIEPSATASPQPG